MVVARLILMSAMLTVGIVETTKTAAPHLAERAPMDASVVAPIQAAPARAAPAQVVPAADTACAAAAWPYLPEACLRSGSSREAEPRRPVRVIEEQRPAAPVRIPGRVSVG